MASEIVPTGDERCDVCAGNRKRAKPKPGERWSVRETVRTMCEACRDDLLLDIDLAGKLTERQPPDDPTTN